MTEEKKTLKSLKQIVDEPPKPLKTGVEVSKITVASTILAALLARGNTGMAAIEASRFYTDELFKKFS